MLLGIIGSFFAALGFGVLFNIKGKNLVLAAIGGMLGATMYRLAQEFGCGEMASMLLGSVSLSLYAEILARVCHTPVTTFLVCALIPLVPGGGMYRTMLAAIQGHVLEALTIGVETMAIAGILVLGILMVSTLMKAIFRPKKVSDAA